MIYVFDINEEVIGFIPSSDLIEAMSTEELNGTHSVDFTAPNKVKDNNYFDLIEKASYVGHRDNSQPSTFHMYSITDIELSSSSFSVEGVHVAFEELSKYDIIRDRRPSNSTAQVMLTSALQDTRWQVGEVDSTSFRDITFYYIDPLEAIRKVKELFGMEVSYRLDFDGSSIVGRYVDLVFERGGDTGIRLYHGSNALSVTREEDRTELYTAYIGRGKGEEQFEDEGGESTDNYTRRITFTDVEWSLSSGDPVDKPLGQDYVEIPELTAEYGFSDGKPRIGVVVFEDIEVGDEETLLEETYKQLLEDSRPKVQYKSTVDRIGQVSIGDSVNIIRKDIEIYFTTRIFKVVRDLLDENRTEVELGDKVDHGQERRRRQIDRKFEDIEQTTSSLVTTLQTRLRENLFNRTAYTYDLRPGNEWDLPSGIWSFDAPIDEDPERVIYIGAGQLAIANSKLPDGTWDFTTFGTGDGFTADLLTAGTVQTAQVSIQGNANFTWDGNFILIQDPSDSSKQIRIGVYDGTNYGIAFTDNGGSTWKHMIGFDGVEFGEDAVFKGTVTTGSNNEVRISDGEIRFFEGGQSRHALRYNRYIPSFYTGQYESSSGLSSDSNFQLGLRYYGKAWSTVVEESIPQLDAGSAHSFTVSVPVYAGVGMQAVSGAHVNPQDSRLNAVVDGLSFDDDVQQVSIRVRAVSSFTGVPVKFNITLIGGR